MKIKKQTKRCGHKTIALRAIRHSFSLGTSSGSFSLLSYDCQMQAEQKEKQGQTDYSNLITRAN